MERPYVTVCVSVRWALPRSFVEHASGRLALIRSSLIAACPPEVLPKA